MLIILVLASIVVGALGLSAAAGAAAPKQIRYYFFVNSPEDVQMVEKLIAKSNSNNPDIKVKGEAVSGGDRYTRLDTMIAGNAAPDVIDMAVEFFPKYVGAKALMPLDKYVDVESMKKDIIPSVLNGWRHDGKLYAIP